jgi:hypothetical protein
LIVKGVRELHAELNAKNYKNNRPGLDRPEWGGTEMTVIDPVNNRITFASLTTANHRLPRAASRFGVPRLSGFPKLSDLKNRSPIRIRPAAICLRTAT